MTTIYSLAKKYYKIICCILILIFIVLGSRYTYYLTHTQKAYYLNKDTFDIIKTRIYIRPIEKESSLQTFIRTYLSGSTEYKAKIPFTSETTLLSISQNKDGSDLVLNWNAYFYKALEQEKVDQEIDLLLKSIKENFPVKRVFFLVENTLISGKWNDFDLKSEIDLSKI